MKLMKFNVVSLFPTEFKQFLNMGVVGRAFYDHLAEVQFFNPRNYTHDMHQTVDDRPYGGGDGMVMMAEPLQNTLQDIKSNGEIGEVYYLSPKGELWSEHLAKKWADSQQPKTLICGRYGGIDQRFLMKNNIKELSIGDYVLSGGELAAMVIMDSVVRKIPNVLGNEVSANEDSFAKKGLLEAPLFTRPSEWESMTIPSVLLSGNHQKINRAREKVSLLITALSRPDIIIKNNFQSDVMEALEEVDQWTDQEIISWSLNKDELQKLKEIYL
ncbi:MAG: tRNA (guanosine(37)-N1)-methyltransferase TrmD [Bdellovibrionales bacterium]|nr:tRNA (guanosine(37)-N1)-methyltransferase TrmD [Bdellovibrionales bacterium]